MGGGMEANKNRWIEEWGTARENLEHNFRWTRRNFALVGLFGIALPVLVYKGIVKEFESKKEKEQEKSKALETKEKDDNKVKLFSSNLRRTGKSVGGSGWSAFGKLLDDSIKGGNHALLLDNKNWGWVDVVEGLPFHLWHRDVFKRISDCCGGVIEVDRYNDNRENLLWARIWDP
ncbi:unnamed protein product [Ilex paraguariensis]|uniref:DUF4283 domain-containing protein n=1 Tax=Ilex paraguariensis TaxID=185542 RepID=A0ABC8SYH3_9AQUA